MRRGPALACLITALLGCVWSKPGNAQVWETLTPDGTIVAVTEVEDVPDDGLEDVREDVREDVPDEPPLPPPRFEAESEGLIRLPDQEVPETPPPPLPPPAEPLAPAAPTVDESPAATDACQEHCGENETCRGWRQHLRRWKLKMQASHWGFPEYFNEPPLGASVDAARDAQIAQGVRDQLFLHHVDFYPDNTARADRLTPYGELRLHEVVRKAIDHGLPLRIETVVGRADLDQARRVSVIEYCRAKGLDIPAEMIVVDVQQRGVSAKEAADIYYNQLQQTKNGGVQSTTSGTGTGTTVTTGATTPSGGAMTPAGQP
jgi:hypothetical protein